MQMQFYSLKEDKNVDYERGAKNISGEKIRNKMHITATYLEIT